MAMYLNRKFGARSIREEGRGKVWKCEGKEDTYSISKGIGLCARKQHPLKVCWGSSGLREELRFS